jgi:hypothetical protein
MKMFNGLLAGLLSAMAGLLLLPALSEAHGTHVTCSAINTISSKLGSTQPVHAFGICRENISISDTRINITLEGNGSGACGDPNNTQIMPAVDKFGVADLNSALVAIRGRNITVVGFDIHGATFATGVQVSRGGSALIGRSTKNETLSPSSFIEQRGNCIRDNKVGIAVSVASSARIINNEIKNNGTGISASENSSILVGFASTGDLDPTAVLPEQAGPGLASPNWIHDNDGNAVAVDRSSSARLNGNKIVNNVAKRDGVSVASGGMADVINNFFDNSGAPTCAGCAAANGNSDSIELSQNAVVNLGTSSVGGCPTPPQGGFPFSATNTGPLGNAVTVLGGTGVCGSLSKLANHDNNGAGTGLGIRCSGTVTSAQIAGGGVVSGKASTDHAGASGANVDLNTHGTSYDASCLNGTN